MDGFTLYDFPAVALLRHSRSYDIRKRQEKALETTRLDLLAPSRRQLGAFCFQFDDLFFFHWWRSFLPRGR